MKSRNIIILGLLLAILLIFTFNCAEEAEDYAICKADCLDELSNCREKCVLEFPLESDPKYEDCLKDCSEEKKECLTCCGTG